MIEGRRIGIDIRSLRPPRTGTGVYLRQLLGALLAREPEARWIGYLPRPLEGLESELPGLQLEVGAGLRARLGAVWLQTTVVEQLRRDRIDLFWGPLQVLPLGALGRVETVVSLHDLVFLRHAATMGRRDRWISRLLVPPSLRRADRVVAVSRSTGEAALQELGLDPGRLRVVPNGVDPRCRPVARGEARRQVAEHWRIEEPYLLFVGTFEPRKNLAGLLAAVDELIGRGRFDGRVVLVGGEGWGSEAVAGLLERSPLRERVVRLGFVEAERLPVLYSGARLFVLPSFYEGFGLPVVEAMACGTPVVCSDREPFPEVAGDAALLVPLERPGALAAAIERAWHDPELRQRLREAGLERSGHYSWERAAEQMVEIFAELLDGSPSAPR